jgi:hypothetical protein
MNPFGHSGRMRLVIGMGRLLERYVWNRQPLLSARDLKMVRYATRRIVEASVEDPH